MPQYCLIKHRIENVTIDGADPDRNPDRIPVTGMVTFTPLLGKGDAVVITENGEKTTLTLSPIEARITNGELWHRGEPGVKLFAGGPDTNPERIRYRAKFSNLIGGGRKVELKDTVFEAAPGGEMELSTVQPAPAQPYPGYTPSMEAAISEISAVRDTSINYAVTKINESRDEVLSEADLAIQAAKDANTVPRVEALELVGGLAPGEPVDGQTANLIEQPSTLTRGAVRAASVEVVHESAPVITVGPAGQFETQSSWDVSTGGDDYRAIQDAIDACPVGGTVHLDFRGRDTFSSETLLVTKPIKITSGTTTDRAGRLWFDMHKTGFVVQAPSTGGARPSNVVMENIYIRGPVPTSHAPSDTEGVGIHVKDGRVHFRDTIVQFVSGHGLYVQAGRQHDHYGDGRDGKGGNVTKSQFDNLRVANVWGDGIKLHGTDTQACLFVKPDIAGCKGWGLNVDTANINQFIMPHFDQQSSEKGMIRDCASSNDYGFIYAETGSNPEIGGLILLDKDTERESVNAKFEVASYAGSVTIVDNTTSRSATFYDRRNRTFRRSLGVTSMDTNHSFQFDSGATSTSAFSLRYIPGPNSPYKEDPGNMTVLDHNLATDLTTLRRRVKMMDQLRLAVVNPPTVVRPNPVNAGAGAIMFDSSIGKIIVSNGSAWTDGAGNPL